MNRDSIKEQVTEIIIDFFDDDELEISDTTVASDVDGWDSLAHISILAALEDAFKIRFSVTDAQKMRNVGAMIDTIIELINEQK